MRPRLDLAFTWHDEWAVELAKDAGAHRRVQPSQQGFDIGKAAADGDDGRAGDIDGQRQRRGDEIDEDIDRPLRLGIAIKPLADDFLAGKFQSMQGIVQALDTTGAADRVDAALLAAAAGIGGDGDRRVAGKRGDDRAVAPFAGKASGSVDEAAICNEAAADAGAENGAEDDAVTASRAGHRLRHGEAIGIVSDQDGIAEFRL